MNLRRACETAHAPRVRARRWLVAATAVVAIGRASAQRERESIPVEFEALLARLVADPEPSLRGEAALGLALTGNPRYHADLRRVAQDRAPAARVRGIVALGILAAPGAEAELGAILLDSAADDPARHAAAFGLAMLPDEQPAVAIDRYLAAISGGSYKRHRDTLAAWLLGLGDAPHPSRMTAVRALIADEANKDPGLHLLAYRALCASDADVEDLTESLLDSPDGSLRHYALARLDEAPSRVVRGHLDRIRASTGDEDARVRSRALGLLVRLRCVEVFDRIPRALGSRHPEDVAAGVAASLTLEGGGVRTSLERRALGAARPEIRTAMLDAWRGRPSPAFVDGCLGIASDTRQPTPLRVAAAAIVASNADARIVPVLRHLVELPQPVDSLMRSYRALQRLDAADDLAARIVPTGTDSFDPFPIRLAALLGVGHVGAFDAMARSLLDDRLTATFRSELLAAWRRTVMSRLADEELAALPSSLAELLR